MTPDSLLRYLVVSNGQPCLTCHPMPLAEAEALRDKLQAAALANGQSLHELRYGLEVA